MKVLGLRNYVLVLSVGYGRLSVGVAEPDTQLVLEKVPVLCLVRAFHSVRNTCWYSHFQNGNLDIASFRSLHRVAYRVHGFNDSIWHLFTEKIAEDLFPQLFYRILKRESRLF